MESTYGDRLHGPKPDYVAELSKILQRTFDRGGNVVIPSFAVGRTQELLYFIREIKEKVLSPATETSRSTSTARWPLRPPAFSKNTDEECYDTETRALLDANINPIQFSGLRVSITSDESRMINADPVPKVILFGQRHVRGGPYPPPPQA